LRLRSKELGAFIITVYLIPCLWGIYNCDQNEAVFPFDFVFRTRVEIFIVLLCCLAALKTFFLSCCGVNSGDAALQALL